MFDRKPVFSSAVLTLKTQAPVAEGNRRLCFRHPDNPNLCIKISKLDVTAGHINTKTFYKRWRPLYRYTYDENLSDTKSYRQSAIRKGGARIWEHLPRLYGWQETDIGPGLVMEYYASADGKPAESLREILLAEGLTSDIESALQVFENWLRETRVIVRTLHLEDIVLAMDGRLKFIDGLALRRVRFYGYMTSIARRRTEERLAKLHMAIDNLIRNTSEPHAMKAGSGRGFV